MRKEPRRQAKIYLQRLFLPPPTPLLVNIHSILVSESCCRVSLDVPRTEDVSLPTQFRFNVRQRCSQLLVQCRTIVYDAGQTLIQHWVCGILCASTLANTWHSPNAVLMFTNSLRRRHNIEAVFGDCTVFAGIAALLCGDAFLSGCHKGHFPDKTIHWPIVDSNVGPPSATLGEHHSNQNHLSSNHEYNLEYIFLNTF